MTVREKFLIKAGTAIASVAILAPQLHATNVKATVDIQRTITQDIRRDLADLAQTNHPKIATATSQLESGDYKGARETIRQIQTAQAKPATSPIPASLELPILIYHDTPANFEAQLIHLKTRGYNTVSLDEVSNTFRYGAPLPAKPVVITFDDGKASNYQAFQLLAKHQMKATFYIANGSGGCIGPNRKNFSCGEPYLSWDQIKEIDRSGLVTIGSHTVDHVNLVGQSPEGLAYQIGSSKQELEAQLGHSVKHFAYPYGQYNARVVQAVQQVGFLTSVSTVAGTQQRPDLLYALTRTRSALALP